MIESATRGLDETSPRLGKEDEQTKSAIHRRRHLLTPREVEIQLALNNDQVQHLISTRQITRIRIAGEDRFDSREIDALIDDYRTTAARRTH